MSPADRVIVRGTHPGTVKNVSADGSLYVVMDNGCASTFSAADVAMLAG